MGIASLIKDVLNRKGIHPRRWLTGLVSYSRYVGYIKPQLMPASEEEFRIRRQLLASAWQPRKLVAPIGKRILALCPHPDDESIGAGGLLLAHRKLAEIHLVVSMRRRRGRTPRGPQFATKRTGRGTPHRVPERCKSTASGLNSAFELSGWQHSLLARRGDETEIHRALHPA
jgi:hypothetical protein